MHPILNIAIKAARRAGALIVRYLDRLDRISVVEKSRNDFVTEIDVLAEQEIVQIIKSSYPEHSILAEESGSQSGSEYEWIIDPIDGTTNYLHGHPQFAISIGVKHKDQLEHGVIFDPLRNELFTTTRGSGAHLNDRRIRVSRVHRLDDALLGTGFPFKELAQLDRWIKTFRVFLTRSHGIRRAGSAALDLAYIACGRLDGFWEFGLSPWDMAAGVLLITEAGGLLSDPDGGQQHMKRGDIVTGNPEIYRAMLKLMKETL